jgi:hypothetical protein
MQVIAVNYSVWACTRNHNCSKAFRRSILWSGEPLALSALGT